MGDAKPVIGLCTDLEDGTGPRCSKEKDIFFFLKCAYVERVVEAGGVPLLLTATRDAAILDRYLDLVDGLILTGSGIDIPAELYGHERHHTILRVVPDKSLFEIELIRRAVARATPFLGICNGMQVMNVAYGGTLVQDLPSEFGVAHAIDDTTVPCHPIVVSAATKLRAIVGAACDVNSSHHQAVRDAGKGLVISARADDDTVEGVEDPAHPFALGVQWHPELIPDHANSRELFRALVEAARRR